MRSPPLPYSPRVLCMLPSHLPISPLFLSSCTCNQHTHKSSILSTQVLYITTCCRGINIVSHCPLTALSLPSHSPYLTFQCCYWNLISFSSSERNRMLPSGVVKEKIKSQKNNSLRVMKSSNNASSQVCMEGGRKGRVNT